LHCENLCCFFSHLEAGDCQWLWCGDAK
jgi:hypothetical protein